MPSLFPNQAHKVFMTITSDRYNAMQKRMKKKKLPPLQFTLEELRQHFLAELGGSSNGIARCGYCERVCAPEECAIDHMIPLSRGGSLGLGNIGFPCAACNDRKGGMTPNEYISLRVFLRHKDPLMEKDVLGRLEKAVKLMAGSTHLRGRIAKLEQKVTEAKQP